jgi:hypothetical protein
MKISPVGAELFHADGRTDMTKLTVAFRNFANAPLKKCLFVLQTDLHEWRKPNPTTDKTLPTGQTKR